MALGAAARELPLDGALLGRLYRNFTETVREVQGFVMRTAERYRRRSAGNLSLSLRVQPSTAPKCHVKITIAWHSNEADELLAQVHVKIAKGSCNQAWRHSPVRSS